MLPLLAAGAGIASGIMGGIAQEGQNREMARARRDYNAGMQNANSIYNSRMGGVTNAFSQIAPDANTVNQYQNALNAQQQTNYAGQYGVNPAELRQGNALGNVNAFIDPSIAFQQQQASDALQASAAGQGNLFSGATGRALAGATQQIAQQGWADAYDRARMADQDYNAVLANQQGLKQQAGQYNVGLSQADIQNYGDIFDRGYNVFSQNLQNQANNITAQRQMEADRIANAAQMRAQAAGMPNAFMGGLNTALNTGSNVYNAFGGGRK